jgi:HAD superfamily hydrolase (TIGR01509 family)
LSSRNAETAVAVGRARRAITGVFLAHSVLLASWVAHIPEFKREFNLSDGALGTILMGAPVGSIVAMLASGPLLGYLGSKVLIQGTLAGYAAAAIIVGLAPSAAALFFALALWGAFQGSLDVAMNTQSVSLEKLHRQPLMNRLHGTWSFAGLIGALIGAGSVKSGLPLTLQQVILTALIVVCVGPLTRHLYHDASRGSEIDSTGPKTRRRKFPVSRITVALGAIAFVSMLSEGIIANWSAEYLRTDLGTSAAYAALGYVAFTLAMATIRLSGSRLPIDRAANTTIPGLATFAALAFGAALVLKLPAVALAGFLALGLGLGCVVPTAFAIAGQRSGGPNAGAAIAAAATAGWVGYVVGPPLIGMLAERFTVGRALWVVPVALLIIAIACRRLSLTGRRELSKQHLMVDYAGVLGHQQRRADIESMAHAISLPVPRFEDRYWLHRRAYDLGQSDQEYWEAVAARPLTTSLVNQLIEIDCASWLHLNEASVAYFAEQAHQGHRLTLLSNAPAPITRRVRDIPALAFFEHMIFSSDVKLVKPDAAMFELALKESGAAARRTTFVDDRLENVLAAERLGMDTVHFKHVSQMDNTDFNVVQRGTKA